MLVIVLALAGLVAWGAWQEAWAKTEPPEELIEDLRIEPDPPQSGDKVSIVVKLSTASPGARVEAFIDDKLVKQVEYDRDRPPVEIETPVKAGNKVSARAIPYDSNGKEGRAKLVSVVCSKAAPSVKVGQQKLDGNSYHAKVEAQDADGKPVTLELKEGPQGMKLSPDGTISWTFPQGTTGRFGVRVTAKDSDGAESILSYSFTLGVTGGR
ncbi:MAG: Ig domain-containing protein [Thermodesulfobacteriota bacterium]